MAEFNDWKKFHSQAVDQNENWQTSRLQNPISDMSEIQNSSLTTIAQSLNKEADLHREYQRALILRAPQRSYELVNDWPVPQLKNDNEVLVKVYAVGLNPVDWKSADYGIAIPYLPAVAGRDLSGIVIMTGRNVSSSQFPVGSMVFGPSTQYRDYRASAFQEYVVFPEHCLARVPQNITLETAAAIGVGAVASVLTLGSALGIPIEDFAPRSLATGAEGEEETWEVEKMLLSGIVGDENYYYTSRSTLPQQGKWLLIWGGSSVTGFFIAQLAKVSGMRVISVADTAKHRERLHGIGIEYVVDRWDPVGAVQTIRELTSRKLTYAVDCVGPETAKFVIECFDHSASRVHLVGLCGLPQITPSNVESMGLPIKTFHTNPAVGKGTMRLITRLVEEGRLVVPDVEVVDGGLGAVNHWIVCELEK